MEPAIADGIPISKSAAKKIAKMAQKQQYKMQKATAAAAAKPAQQACSNAVGNSSLNKTAQRMLDAAGNPMLTPCGRPVIELGGFKFADLYDHEYQKILDMFKNHISGITITKEKIQHIIFGEVMGNGTHAGGHFDFGAFALSNNNANLTLASVNPVTGVVQAVMTTAKKVLNKYHFPHDTDPVLLFEKIRDELNSPSVQAALKNIGPSGETFSFVYGSTRAVFAVKPNMNIVTCFPEI